MPGGREQRSYFLTFLKTLIDSESPTVKTENAGPAGSGGGAMSFLDQLKLKQQQKMNKGKKKLAVEKKKL